MLSGIAPSLLVTLTLGSSAEYDGIVEQRPPLGPVEGVHEATAMGIVRVWRLVLKAVALWAFFF
jgi:hypothetical protein